MAAELRWILLALSVPLLAGIWWWSVRRSRQSPGNAHLRETVPPAVHTHAPSPAEHSPRSPALQESASYESALEHRTEAAARDFGVPPFEPLSIRTADFEEVSMADMAMTAGDEPVEAADLDFQVHDLRGTAHADRYHADRDDAARYDTPAHPGAAPDSETPDYPSSAAEHPAAVFAYEIPADAAATGTWHEADPADAPAAAPSRSSPVGEPQRIVTLRVVCADHDARWYGSELLAALENHGLAYGHYKVFHRKLSDGQTLFCAASLVEPGTFDLERMPHDAFRGLTLFAVLPGPADALQTIDALLETAEGLAAALHGTVQDSKGMPLSVERAAALREDVARFQAPA